LHGNAGSKPEILNSDQGSQFTSKDYINLVESSKIKVSMDGKGRWADNIMIERWFRTLKYDEVYLNDYENIKEARREIGNFIYNYNFVKLHSSLGYETPADMYYPRLLMVSNM
jgi:putative transposase